MILFFVLLTLVLPSLPPLLVENGDLAVADLGDPEERVARSDLFRRSSGAGGARACGALERPTVLCTVVGARPGGTPKKITQRQDPRACNAPQLRGPVVLPSSRHATRRFATGYS